MLCTLAIALACVGEQPRIAPAAVESVEIPLRRVTGSWLLMNDPAAVEALLKTGRGSAILPAHYAPAIKAAKSLPGLGAAVRTASRPEEAGDANALFRGRSAIQPAARITENLSFPTVDAWEGREKLVFRGVSLKGGPIRVRSLMNEGIHAVEIRILSPDLGDDGELQWTSEPVTSGRGDSAPLKPGQGYALVLEMDAATAGRKRGLIQVQDGSLITLSLSGLVTNQSAALGAQFQPELNDFVAGKTYERTLRVTGAPGAEVRINPPAVPGLQIQAPETVKLPAAGRLNVKVRLTPTAGMADVSGSTAFFSVASDRTVREAGLPYSVSTSWLVSEEQPQKAGGVQTWSSCRIHSSGYSLASVRLWADSEAEADSAEAGFVLSSGQGGSAPQLGFLNRPALGAGYGPKFWSAHFEGQDPRLALSHEKAASISFALFLNNSSAREAWESKSRLERMSLRNMELLAPEGS